MNRKNDGMVGATRLVASKVGVAVVDGHEIRAPPANDRGQPRAILEKKM